MNRKLGKIPATSIVAMLLMGVVAIFPVYASSTRIYMDPAVNYLSLIHI